MPVDFTFSVTAQGRLTEPEEFEQIVVKHDRGRRHRAAAGRRARRARRARLRLLRPSVNGKPTVPIGIFLQPGANALEVGDAIHARMRSSRRRSRRVWSTASRTTRRNT